MKKLFLFILISLISSNSFAQWAVVGDNLITGTNVGIGTNNPQSKLHVVGDIFSNNYIVPHNQYIGATLSDAFKYKERSMGHYALSWMNDSWSSGGSTLWQSGYGGIKFFTQGQYRMGITTGGNVGIGTDNPQSKLHVVGDIFSNNYIVPYNQYIGAALSDAFKYKERSMGHYALSWMNDSWSSGGSTLWQSGYGGIKFFTQGQYRMGITTGGNVGIGTDNPQYSFDVYGNSRITDNLYLGKQLSLSAGGEVVRMSIVPYRHTGGPWNFVSRDTPTQAYLDISYNIYQMFSLTYFNGKGKVGIGVKDPQCELDVKGTIRATEVKIEDISNWSDFVFDTDYKLPLLSEVETHINIHKHLPDVPSQAQVKEEGINVVEMQAKLLQKIEELTLYVIKQDKEINELKKALPHNYSSKGEGSH